MKNNNSKDRPVQVQLIIRPSCGICKRVHEELDKLRGKHAAMHLQVYDVEKGSTLPKGKQPFITPAVWVNGSLWYLGGFNPQRFEEKLNRLENELQRSVTFYLT
jgi:hypothetical protein